MSIASFSARRRITVLMIVLGVAVFGWFSLDKLELKLLPEISYPSITIRTQYPGASPEEVESFISKPIEELLGVISNLQEITSISIAGSSDVIVELTWDANMDRAVMDIREKLDSIQLPEEAERSRILRFNPEDDPIMKLAFSGDDLVSLHRFAEKDIKPRLETLEGVAAAQIVGGEEEEILIEVDASRLSMMKISLTDVTQRLRLENINMPGGILEEGNVQYIVRTLNEFKNEAEIGEIVVGSSGGADIRLKDVASITRSLKEKTTLTHLNGAENVGINIYKEGDANIIDVAKRVRSIVEGEATAAFGKSASLKSRLPEGMNLQIVSDQSNFINAAIGEVKSNAVVGSLLAIFILYLFLKNIAHTSIVAVAIPISIVATFTAMMVADVSLNLMSLGGLALGVGMLVDNSIVVLENIFKKKEAGQDNYEASVIGTNEISMAVTASTLTTVAVFFPIIFVSGIAGQIFKDLAFTVTGTLICSLLVSLSIIPMISSIDAGLRTSNFTPIGLVEALQNGRSGFWKRIQRRAKELLTSCYETHLKPAPGPRSARKRLAWIIVLPFMTSLFLIDVVMRFIGRLILYTTFIVMALGGGLIRSVWFLIVLALKPLSIAFDFTFLQTRKFYQSILKKALAKPSHVIGIGLAFFVITIVAIVPRLGVSMIPQMAQGEFYIDLKTPVGTTLRETEKVIGALEKSIIGMPGVERVSATIGTTSADDWNASIQKENIGRVEVQLHEDFRSKDSEERIIDRIRNAAGKIPGIQSYEIQRPTFFTINVPLEIELRSQNLTALRQNSERLVKRLKQEKNLAEVHSTLEEGYPEIHIVFDRLKLAKLGIDISTIASELANMIEGVIPTNFMESDSEIDVRVRAKREEGLSVDRLRNINIGSNSESPIPLSAVASIVETVGPSEIRRVDQRRIALVRADVRILDMKSAVEGVRTVLRGEPPDSGVSYAIVGQNTEMESAIRSLQIAFAMAVFLVYLVMASQFESLMQPFLILFSIPLALVGVVLALWIFGIPISVMVFIGLIVLVGIAVNNAILLIDAINYLRSSGKDLMTSILEGVELRIRPIFMTTLTTVLGLIPMIMGGGAGIEIRRPLAVTVIVGLTASTFLTLVIIPVLCYLAENKKR